MTHWRTLVLVYELLYNSDRQIIMSHIKMSIGIGCVMMNVMAHLNCYQKVQSAGRHVTIGIKEEKPTYTKHDMLFKQLIQNFFDSFLELFFPNIYKRINLKTIEFLSEEMFTDIVNGTTRRLDIVVQAKLNKEETLIIIHIEPQSYEQRNFNERMRSEERRVG